MHKTGGRFRDWELHQRVTDAAEKKPGISYDLEDIFQNNKKELAKEKAILVAQRLSRQRKKIKRKFTRTVYN